MNKEFNW